MKKTNFVIIVIGVGGTGGYYASYLSRFLSNSTFENTAIGVVNLVLVDGDTVELKNCSRQQFISSDVGESKAENLQLAIMDNFGLDVFSYTQYITRVDDIKNIYSKFDNDKNQVTIPIIVGCVDNHAARKVLEEYFSITPSLFYWDAANEYNDGEVVFSCKKDGEILSEPRSFYYPDVLTTDEKSRTEISCDELNKVEPQHIVTNIMASNILMSATSQLLKLGTIPKGIVYFDSFTFNMVNRIL